MLFPVLVWTWRWQKAVLIAEDTLSLLLADESLRGCAMGEGCESSECLQLVTLGKAMLFWAFLSWTNWLFSTVFSSGCALGFLMPPLYQVHPREARRSSYWSSVRRIVKGSSTAPPKSPLHDQDQVKVIYKPIPPLCLALSAQEWGGTADRVPKCFVPQYQRFSFSSPFPSIKSCLEPWQTILQSAATVFFLHLCTLNAHILCYLRWFLSEKQVLS